MKRLSTEAYTALREALSVVTWNKRPFESMVRTLLRETPELLAGINGHGRRSKVAGTAEGSAIPDLWRLESPLERTRGG